MSYRKREDLELNASILRDGKKVLEINESDRDKKIETHISVEEKIAKFLDDLLTLQDEYTPSSRLFYRPSPEEKEKIRALRVAFDSLVNVALRSVDSGLVKDPVKRAKRPMARIHFQNATKDMRNFLRPPPDYYVLYQLFEIWLEKFSELKVIDLAVENQDRRNIKRGILSASERAFGSGANAVFQAERQVRALKASKNKSLTTQTGMNMPSLEPSLKTLDDELSLSKLKKGGRRTK